MESVCFVNATGASEKICSLVLVKKFRRIYFHCLEKIRKFWILRFIMKAVLSACILMLCGSSFAAVKFRECFLLHCKNSIFSVLFNEYSVLFLPNFCFSPNWFCIVASDIVRCRKGDSECIIKSANDVMKIYSQGSLFFLSSHFRLLIWILS